jgi:uncharacterized protein YwqG
VVRLPIYRATFEPTTEEVDDRKLGMRSKLGGGPTWQQYDETPKCPRCRQPMSFVAQIDSIHHDSDDNPHRVDCTSAEPRYMFGDVGLIYVFFCFDDLEARCVFQCG